MEYNLMDQIWERFRLETSLLRLERQENAAEQALRQAKYNLREAEQEQLLYSGSFRAFWDKLTGKREEKELTLHRAVKQAEADLAAAGQEKAAIHGKLLENRDQLLQLPDPAELKSKASGKALEEFLRLESLLTMDILEQLLEENLAALEELHRIYRGERVSEFRTGEVWSEVRTMPEQQATQIFPLLQKLEENLSRLGMGFTVEEYFRASTVFLNPAAAHNRLERVSQAITQTERTRREIQVLQEQLEDRT